jgi:hypothetical protein
MRTCGVAVRLGRCKQTAGPSGRCAYHAKLADDLLDASDEVDKDDKHRRPQR